MSASSTSIHSLKTRNLFEKCFHNEVFVISCTQPGNFGMDVEIADKISSNLNTKSLVFYSYDKATKIYKQIVATPNYWVDSVGYLHFNTKSAGDIIITDKQLEKQ